MYICEMPKQWRDELENMARSVGAYSPDFHDSRITDVLECMGLPGWKIWHMCGPVWRIWKRYGLHTVDVGYHSTTGRWYVMINRHHVDGLVAQSSDALFFNTLHDAVQVYDVLEAMQC